MTARETAQTLPGDGCPLCGAGLAPGRGFAVDGRQFAFCPGCLARVATPLPEREAMEVFYRDRYHDVFGPAEAGPRRQAMLGRLLARIPRKPPGRFLDVGCGAGHLLLLARAAGWDAVGVDPSAEACARARAQHGLEVKTAVLEEADLPDSAFDIVTLVNVLDQAPDPVRLLAAARRVLRPAGLLVIRVPNGDFHRAAWGLIRRASPRALRRLRPLVIFHPICLNARALHGLLARGGFGGIRIVNSPSSGTDWDAPRGASGQAALACLAAVAQVGAQVVARVTAGRILAAPSLLAFAERESD